jgi:endonuclease/exonuclease/phosphatase family metal-dependent hydrolase
VPLPRGRVVAGVLATLALIPLSLTMGGTAAAAPAPRSLMFATYNVCLVTCTAPAPSWSVRRDRVARVIEHSRSDVLSLSEATNIKYGSITQWEDIQHLTAPFGYVAPHIDDDRCARLGCVHTARLMFKSTTVQQLHFPQLPSAGFWRVGDIAPAIETEGTRQVTWAYLKSVNGTGPFLAVAVHLSTFKTAAAEQHRLAFGHAVTAWAEAMNAARGLAGAPTVLMGDFNSYQFRQPQGVQQVLLDDGWGDAFDAPVRANIHINSINYTPTQPSGWPRRPIYNKWRPAARIDYIMFRGAVKPLTYAVVVYTNPDGNFDNAYRGSDHLMVRGRLQFGP